MNGNGHAALADGGGDALHRERTERRHTRGCPGRSFPRLVATERPTLRVKKGSPPNAAVRTALGHAASGRRSPIRASSREPYTRPRSKPVTWYRFGTGCIVHYRPDRPGIWTLQDALGRLTDIKDTPRRSAGSKGRWFKSSRPDLEMWPLVHGFGGGALTAGLPGALVFSARESRRRGGSGGPSLAGERAGPLRLARLPFSRPRAPRRPLSARIGPALVVASYV